MFFLTNLIVFASLLSFESLLISQIYFVFVIVFCGFFLFFTRFHRSFLESSAITDLVSHASLKETTPQADSFISHIDQDIVILIRMYNEELKIHQTLDDLYTQ